jgi:DNA polymerase-3 subunit gamma/tau
LLSFAQRIPADTLQLYYQIALLGRLDIGLAPDEYAGFTMSLLSMLAFAPSDSATTSNAKPAQTASIAKPSAAKLSASAALKTEPVAAKPIETDAPSNEIADVAIAKPIGEDTPHADSGSNFDGNWRGLVDELKLGLARELARHCELIAYDENAISLSVPESQKHLLSPNYQEKLGSAISQYFDKKIKLQFSIGGTGNTPAKQISQEKAVAQANAEVAIEEDNFVQALIHDFGATIIPNSIKPI